MRIAIVGYGKMGHEIEAVAKARGHSVVTIDSNLESDFSEINDVSMEGVDVAIDFSVADACIDNVKAYNKCKVNAVIGTTGWYDRMEEMKAACPDIGLIWSGNFSIGVNIFFRIIEYTSKMMDNIEDYDALCYELHHSGKADSPSGTAKMIGKILVDNIKRKAEVVTDKLDRKIGSNELHFASVRGGNIHGTHTVMFDSEADTIELTHRARSRKGFALGAIMAAEWVKDKPGFFNIDDFMRELIK